MTTTVTVNSHGHHARVAHIPHEDGKPNVVTGDAYEVYMGPKMSYNTCVHSQSKIEITEVSPEDPNAKAAVAAGVPTSAQPVGSDGAPLKAPSAA